MKYNSSKSDLNPFIQDVKVLYSIFKKNMVVKNNSIISRGHDSLLLIKDKTSKTYTLQGIQELGDSIIIVRNKLIEGNH